MTDEDDVRYLYVIQFANGIVKVGQTNDIRRRYKDHLRWARQTRTSIAEVNFGYRDGSARPDERKLIQFCLERWQRLEGHAEYFVGADFEEVDAYFMALERAAGDERWGPTRP